MKRVTLPLSLLVCSLGALCASAETMANWQFDDGEPTNAAASLITETNAPTLNAAAGRYSSGAKYPSFDADRPGTRIWASFSGPLLNSTNASSLRFINADLPGSKDSQNGGLATVPDNALLRATNLTVEAFLKVDRRVNYPLVVGKVRGSGNTSWNLDFDNSGKPRVRIDSSEVLTNGAPGWNQSWTAAVNVEDGKWHHVAFTYSHTNKAIKLYVDYILSVSGNTYSNLVYDSGELRIASGAGARGFDGWIDEIRLTDSVLLPEQFMTVTEPTSTRGYWAFDDGASGATANTLTNAFFVPLENGTAESVSGGAKPVFSSARPPATTARISDGLKGVIVNLKNDGSLLFTNAAPPSSVAGGAVTVPDSLSILRLTNFTAEAFFKVNRHVGWPLIIGKPRADDGGATWALGLGNTGTPFARFDTQPYGAGGGSGFNETLVPATYVEDGKWHHMALTYSDSNRTARIYVDYVQVGSRVVYSNLVYDASALRLGQGAGFYPFDGWIDEARLTDRVLAPTEFLYTVPVMGTSILIN